MPASQDGQGNDDAQTDEPLQTQHQTLHVASIRIRVRQVQITTLTHTHTHTHTRVKCRVNSAVGQGPSSKLAGKKQSTMCRNDKMSCQPRKLSVHNEPNLGVVWTDNN